MTTIITAADAAEFLALVPRLAGFRPVRSIALVPFHGARSHGVVRVDLPPPDADVDSIAATLVGLVCKIPEVDALAVVVYTDQGLAGDDGAIVHDRLVRALLGRADACGLGVRDALCVAADGWASYLDDSPLPGAAPTSHPLEELADETVADRLPEGLRAPLGDQSTGAELPEVDAAQSAHTARALQTLGEAVDAVCAATGEQASAHADLARLDPQALAAACALDDIPALFEDALRWDAAALRPFDAAALIWCLSRPALRDIALVQWCTDSELGTRALQAQLRWEKGEDYPRSLAAYLWGEGERPDPERLHGALELTRQLAARAPRAAQPGPLAAAGWLSWALGRSTHAAWYAARATEIEPEHGLCGILISMLNAGHLPEFLWSK